MSYNNPFFPSSVWDGLSFNSDRTDKNANINPNSDDWERIAPEVEAIEEFLINGAGAPSNFEPSPKAIETVTAASDTLDLDNRVVLCDCTSNAITLTLPTAASSTGIVYNIKKIDVSGNAVTIDGNGAETIDGAATASLAAQWNTKTLVSNGTSWFLIVV